MYVDSKTNKELKTKGVLPLHIWETGDFIYIFPLPYMQLEILYILL